MPNFDTSPPRGAHRVVHPHAAAARIGAPTMSLPVSDVPELLGYLASGDDGER